MMAVTPGQPRGRSMGDATLLLSLPSGSCAVPCLLCSGGLTGTRENPQPSLLTQSPPSPIPEAETLSFPRGT